MKVDPPDGLNPFDGAKFTCDINIDKLLAGPLFHDHLHRLSQGHRLGAPGYEVHVIAVSGTIAASL